MLLQPIYTAYDDSEFAEISHNGVSGYVYVHLLIIACLFIYILLYLHERNADFENKQ